MRCRSIVMAVTFVHVDDEYEVTHKLVIGAVDCKCSLVPRLSRAKAVEAWGRGYINVQNAILR